MPVTLLKQSECAAGRVTYQATADDVATAVQALWAMERGEGGGDDGTVYTADAVRIIAEQAARAAVEAARRQE